MEERPKPPLMLKEWMELESSAEHSRDGFECYPRHLGGNATELRSGCSRGRNSDVLARVSAAIRAALFPPSRRETALSRSLSWRLRGGLWKRRKGEVEATDKRVASCSATAASGRNACSSPAISPRRRNWEGGEAGDTCAGSGHRSHETEVVECKTTCGLDEQQQQLSPVSVLDFLSQDEEDDEGDEGYHDHDGDGDNEIAAPTFQQSLTNIERAGQELLKKIRQFEQLADLDTSEVNEATKDSSCHVDELNYIEKTEGGPTWDLLGLLEASSPGPIHCFQTLLVDFFREGLSSCHVEGSNGSERAQWLLEAAKVWLGGQVHSLKFRRRVEMGEIAWIKPWRCFREDEQELLAGDLERGIFWSLVGELLEE